MEDSDWIYQIPYQSAQEWRVGWETKVEPFYAATISQVGPAGLVDTEPGIENPNSEGNTLTPKSRASALSQRTPIAQRDTHSKSTPSPIFAATGSPQNDSEGLSMRRRTTIRIESDPEDDSDDQRQNTVSAELPSLMESDRARSPKRKRDPLEDTIANSSPLRHATITLAKRARCDSLSTPDENNALPGSSPVDGGHASETRSQDSPVDEDVPSSSAPSHTESNASGVLMHRPPKLHSSGTDTQDKIDAQILADMEEGESNGVFEALDGTEEAESEVEETEQNNDQVDQISDGEDDDSPKDFETAQHEPVDHRSGEESPDAFETALPEHASDLDPDESLDAFETAPQPLPLQQSPLTEPSLAKATPAPASRPLPRAFLPTPSSPILSPSRLDAVLKSNADSPSVAAVQKHPRAAPEPPFPSEPVSTAETVAQRMAAERTAARQTVAKQTTAKETDPRPVPSVVEWAQLRVSAQTPLAAIVDALRATSMDIDTTDALLARLRTSDLSYDERSGRGTSWLPEDIPGVWTARDDQDLKDGGKEDRRRVRVKHGEEGVEARWLFWKNGG